MHFPWLIYNNNVRFIYDTFYECPLLVMTSASFNFVLQQETLEVLIDCPIGIHEIARRLPRRCMRSLPVHWTRNCILYRIDDGARSPGHILLFWSFRFEPAVVGPALSQMALFVARSIFCCTIHWWRDTPWTSEGNQPDCIGTNNRDNLKRIQPFSCSLTEARTGVYESRKNLLFTMALSPTA